MQASEEGSDIVPSGCLRLFVVVPFLRSESVRDGTSLTLRLLEANTLDQGVVLLGDVQDQATHYHIRTGTP